MTPPTVSSSSRSIRVRLAGDAADRSYTVVIGSGVLGGLGAAIHSRPTDSVNASRAIIVADSAVLVSHAAAAEASLQAAGIDTQTLTVLAGDSAKSVTEAARLWRDLAHLAADRHTHIVAVGGGVVGDLTGFVAATFARGLPFWQVPTTLMAQVDSAVGGKTGINLDAGKNLVGAFWQPLGVVADVNTLATLPEREFKSGLAEVVKYGMILDAQFFGWLETNAHSVMARDPAAILYVVERSVALKADVVERDEHERSGLRAVLNYGHTFAHAFETTAGYGVLLHGEAVAIGMACAARLAMELGHIGADIVARQDRLLESLGLPLRAPCLRHTPAEKLLAVMARDKKAVAGRLNFVLPERLGHVGLVGGIDPSLVCRVLMQSLLSDCPA